MNRPKEFYYTNEQMVKDLLAITPISGSVLDVGSGKNKVWFNNLQGEKYECEIEDGSNFYDWIEPVDWVIGNPPFHEGWEFMKQSVLIARKGIAFLGNINFFNQFTTRRLEYLKERDWYLQHIKVLADKRWFGRYYYLIFGRENKELVSWELKSY